MTRSTIITSIAVALCLTAAAQIARWDLKMVPSEHGSWAIYKFYAAADWRYPARKNELDTPSLGPNWPLLADMDGTAKSLVILYWREVNGVARFTNASGGPWRAPQRWAYIRLNEDEWNGANHKPKGDGAVADKAPDLDTTMRWLAGFGFSKKAVMDAMDKVTWTDSTGAPE